MTNPAPFSIFDLMKKFDDYIWGETQESELGEISELVNSAYRGESSRAGWTTEADFLGGQRTDPQTLLQHLKDKNRKIFRCRDRDSRSLLGCVYLERNPDDSCYLGMLTVRPHLQNSGLGKVIMNHAEELARQWGARRMVLGVIQLRSELMAWYERRGYRKTGETKPFPYGDPKAGQPLREDLHFVMFEKIL